MYQVHTIFTESKYCLCVTKVHANLAPLGMCMYKGSYNIRMYMYMYMYVQNRYSATSTWKKHVYSILAKEEKEPQVHIKHMYMMYVYLCLSNTRKRVTLPG